MKISARLVKLERNESLTGPPTVLDRYRAELDNVALRLTGKRWQTIAADAQFADLVSEKLNEFLRSLSDKDLAILKSELERIEFGGDTAARDEAYRVWRSSFSCESKGASSAG
jgi:hypothetical protein